MKKVNCIILFVSLISTFFSGCKQVSQPENIKHVIIIGVDGMSVAGLIDASTPNFDQYIKNGAYTFNARNVLPTVSSPNWEAMLTGSGVALTGVTSNDWRFDNYSLPPVVRTENGRFPDIFYALKRGNKSIITSSIYQWTGFENLYDNSFVDLNFNCKDEEATAVKVAEIIKSDKPNFLFIHFDHVDHAGHTLGHMTPGYLKSVELADQLAGVVVEATKEAGIFDETLFMIVSDHGGKGFDHGHETVEGNEVPFILFGKGIKKGYKIPAAVNLYDVAATSAFVLNVEIPQVWEGEPVYCAFIGSPEPRNLIGNFMAPASFIPQISPRKINSEVGGLFIGKNAVVTIKSKGTDGKIRYTTDGSIPSINSAIYGNPFEMTNSGVVKASFFGNNGTQSDFSKGYFRVIKDVSKESGINYTLFSGNDWKKIPAIASLKPGGKGKTYEISIDEIEDKIKESTAVQFDGWLTIKEKGQYTFATVSDDGSKLFIDGVQVVDNDGDHGIQEREGSVNLSVGKHRIKVEYLNAGGGFFLNCLYSGPGIPKQIISPDILSIAE